MQGPGCAVTRHATRAAGVDGGNEMGAPGESLMPDRVDAAVERVEPARPHPPQNAVLRQPGLEQLRRGRHPMLAPSERSNDGIHGLWALLLAVCATCGAHRRRVADRV